LTALARRVLDDEVLPRRAGDGALHHFDEPAHTVLLVHHEVAGLQLHRIDRALAAARQPGEVARRCTLPEHVGLSQHDELRGVRQEAGVERPT
jgi:hypothetical protein